MRKFSLLVTILVVLVQTACVQSKDGKENSAANQEKAPVSFRVQLQQVVEANEGLKQALVSSDAQQTKTAAQKTLSALDQTDAELLQDAAQQEWLNLRNSMQKAASAIAGSEDIEQQRQSFASFSDALYHSAKQFGITGEAYYQYCPMAFNDQGGYWLSETREIRNPYFGESMLKCGSTKETIR